MIRLPSRNILTIWVLLSLLTPIQGQNGLNTTCWQLASAENVTQISYPVNGYVVYYITWSWFVQTPVCLGNGPSGVRMTGDFILVLTAFALPAVIFSTVIPRRWRLDIPQRFLTVGRSRVGNISKLFLSIPAICAVAAVDMIGWITCIMTFAGPMAFSGVLEMFLDFRVVSFLERNRESPAKERLEAIVALLCGNYDQDPDDPAARIHSSLIPSQLTKASLESTKSRLVTILNSQVSFGTTIGLPAVFFLGGFWYNAVQTNPRGAVSYGIFLMVLVIVTIISGTLLAGNSPHTVSVLLGNRHVKRTHGRGLFLSDVYDSELHPVAMWDRGFSKYQWLKNTMMWQQQGAFQDAVRVDVGSWAAITAAAWLLVATPCLFSLTLSFFVPWPWFGSSSLVLTIYLASQTWLILVALVVAYLDAPLCTIWRPFDLLPKATSQSLISRSLLVIFTFLTGGATFLAALCIIFASGYHLSDGYGEELIWTVPVSSWVKPASKRLVVVYTEPTTQAYADYIANMTQFLPLGAVILTCVICFLGWWYHEALRIALKDAVENIEE